jgi:hypothetical protein
MSAVIGYHLRAVPGWLPWRRPIFVLSGFSITTLLLEEHSEPGAISLRRFYGRRALRLVPVAVAAIVFIEIILVAANNGLRGQALVGVYSAFYVENLAHFLHPPVVSHLGHFWSRSQEAQFYFLGRPCSSCCSDAASHLMDLRRSRWNRRADHRHRAMLANDWHRVYYAPDTHADGMALGCLLPAGRV